MTESNVVSATTWLSTTNKYTKRVDLKNTEEWRREHPEIIEESAPAVADEALRTTPPSPTEAAGVTETPAPTEEAKVTDTPAPNEREDVTETPSPTTAEDNETSQKTTITRIL